MFLMKTRNQQWCLCAVLLALVMVWGAVADAQTPDLDLVTERSLGLSVSATGGAEYRSGLIVAPWQFINGGVFVYGTQSVVDGESVEDTIRWRVQGGPQWQKVSLQFYIDSLHGQRLDYAWFIRPGEWNGSTNFYSLAVLGRCSVRTLGRRSVMRRLPVTRR